MIAALGTFLFRNTTCRTHWRQIDARPCHLQRVRNIRSRFNVVTKDRLVCFLGRNVALTHLLERCSGCRCCFLPNSLVVPGFFQLLVVHFCLFAGHKYTYIRDVERRVFLAEELFLTKMARKRSAMRGGFHAHSGRCDTIFHLGWQRNQSCGRLNSLTL